MQNITEHVNPSEYATRFGVSENVSRISSITALAEHIGKGRP
jgi:hypothetical protein